MVLQGFTCSYYSLSSFFCMCILIFMILLLSTIIYIYAELSRYVGLWRQSNLREGGPSWCFSFPFPSRVYFANCNWLVEKWTQLKCWSYPIMVFRQWRPWFPTSLGFPRFPLISIDFHWLPDPFSLEPSSNSLERAQAFPCVAPWRWWEATVRRTAWCGTSGIPARPGVKNSGMFGRGSDWPRQTTHIYICCLYLFIFTYWHICICICICIIVYV